MKKWFGILLLFVLDDLVAAKKSMDLATALKKQLVKGQVISKGGFSGHCLSLRLDNKGQDSLQIRIEPGRRFRAPQEDKQDLLVVKEFFLVLGSYGSATADIKVYCCQAGDRAPQAMDVFGWGDMADSNLVRLADFLNQNAFEEHAEQQAVWSLSNGHPAAGISGDNDSLILPLRQFVARLKGEVLPWYSIKTQTYVFKSGHIRVVPTRLKGDLIYSLNENSYVTILVTDENGLPAGIIKSHWLQPSASGTYSLELPLRGLDKGKYRVELKTEKNVLAANSFEL